MSVISDNELKDIHVGAKILVVDDSQGVVELIKAILSLDGYDVIETFSAEQALEVLRHQTPDLILSDLMMPDTDGLELLGKIKSTYPEYIPIILMTASNQSQDRLLALEAGADDFLAKPMNKYELKARIKNLIQLKKLKDELNLVINENRKLVQELALNQASKKNNHFNSTYEAGKEDNFEEVRLTSDVLTEQIIYPLKNSIFLLEQIQSQGQNSGNEVKLVLDNLHNIEVRLESQLQITNGSRKNIEK